MSLRRRRRKIIDVEHRTRRWVQISREGTQAGNEESRERRKTKSRKRRGYRSERRRILTIRRRAECVWPSAGRGGSDPRMIRKRKGSEVNKRWRSERWVSASYPGEKVRNKFGNDACLLMKKIQQGTRLVHLKNLIDQYHSLNFDISLINNRIKEYTCYKIRILDARKI